MVTETFAKVVSGLALDGSRVKSVFAEILRLPNNGKHVQQQEREDEGGQQLAQVLTHCLQNIVNISTTTVNLTCSTRDITWTRNVRSKRWNTNHPLPTKIPSSAAAMYNT